VVPEHRERRNPRSEKRREEALHLFHLRRGLPLLRVDEVAEEQHRVHARLERRPNRLRDLALVVEPHADLEVAERGDAGPLPLRREPGDRRALAPHVEEPRLDPPSLRSPPPVGHRIVGLLDDGEYGELGFRGIRFEDLDQDDDGFVSSSELVSGTFQEWDADDDGWIDRNEFGI
jgi:hypothetical protein